MTYKLNCQDCDPDEISNIKGLKHNLDSCEMPYNTVLKAYHEEENKISILNRKLSKDEKIIVLLIVIVAFTLIICIIILICLRYCYRSGAGE